MSAAFIHQKQFLTFFQACKI